MRIFLISYGLPLAVLFIGFALFCARGGGLLLKDYNDKKISDTRLARAGKIALRAKRLTALRGGWINFFSPYFSGVNDYSGIAGYEGRIEGTDIYKKKERD